MKPPHLPLRLFCSWYLLSIDSSIIAHKDFSAAWTMAPFNTFLGRPLSKIRFFFQCLGIYQKCLNALIFKNPITFPTLYYCSTFIHPLSEQSILAPVSLRPDFLSLLWLVSSHRPDQAPPTVSQHQLSCAFVHLRPCLGSTCGKLNMITVKRVICSKLFDRIFLEFSSVTRFKCMLKQENSGNQDAFFPSFWRFPFYALMHCIPSHVCHTFLFYSCFDWLSLNVIYLQNIKMTSILGHFMLMQSLLQPRKPSADENNETNRKQSVHKMRLHHCHLLPLKCVCVCVWYCLWYFLILQLASLKCEIHLWMCT